MTLETAETEPGASPGTPLSDPHALPVSNDLDPLTAARAYLDASGAAALVTVIDTWGSAPVPIGGQMVVSPDGRFAGSVSGGCIEGDIMVAAEQALAAGVSRVMSFGVADERAWRVGLPCGGNIRVLIEPLTRDRDQETLARLQAAAPTRESVIVATDLDTGVRRLIAAGALDAEVAHLGLSPDFAARLHGGDSRVAVVVTDPTAASGPTREIFFKTYAPPARIVIVGATHIAQVLAELARIAGYGAIVVDPREAYAARDRFGPTEVLVESPEAAFAQIGIDAFTAVVALAHVIHLDDEALRSGLRSQARYIGVLGSRRNRDRRRERLLAEGFAPGDIDRIRSPVGLDIGALTPAEIAVAILAEVIETVRGKRRT